MALSTVQMTKIYDNSNIHCALYTCIDKKFTTGLTLN